MSRTIGNARISLVSHLSQYYSAEELYSLYHLRYGVNARDGLRKTDIGKFPQQLIQWLHIFDATNFFFQENKRLKRRVTEYL